MQGISLFRVVELHLWWHNACQLHSPASDVLQEKPIIDSQLLLLTTPTLNSAPDEGSWHKELWLASCFKDSIEQLPCLKNVSPGRWWEAVHAHAPRQSPPVGLKVLEIVLRRSFRDPNNLRTSFFLSRTLLKSLSNFASLFNYIWDWVVGKKELNDMPQRMVVAWGSKYKSNLE